MPSISLPPSGGGVAVPRYSRSGTPANDTDRTDIDVVARFGDRDEAELSAAATSG